MDLGVRLLNDNMRWTSSLPSLEGRCIWPSNSRPIAMAEVVASGLQTDTPTRLITVTGF